MKALIVSGGNITDYNYIKNKVEVFKPELIIAADSGYNHALSMNLRVDLVVGDFDSIAPPKNPKNIKIMQYNAEKNLTDTEIALLHARERGADEFLLTGVTGTRQDHALTNILMLKDCLERGEIAVIIDEHNRIRILGAGGKLEIEGRKGDLVSLVALEGCAGVCIKGVKYPLDNAELKVGSGFGVSNEFLGEKAAVSLEKGTILVIEARD